MDFVKESEKSMIELIEKLVNIDSGSYNKEGIDRIGKILIKKYLKMGFDYQRINNDTLGDHLVIQHKDAAETDILLLAHMDTVFSDGTATARPFKIINNRAYGPGVIDMKSSLVMLLYSVKQLFHIGDESYKNISILLTSDEEIGSPTSKQLIRKVSETKKYALVMEPAREDGSIVSSRRGGGSYQLTVKGRATHAGVSPEEGVSAIEELAYKIVELEKLNSLDEGISISVGIVEGGEAVNVIPDKAEASIDIRISSIEQGKRLAKKIEEICSRPNVEGAEIILEGGLGRQPMELTQKNLELVEIVKEVGRSIGLELKDTHTGGGSDASFPSEVGVATIDGLGPIGGELHSEDEYLEVSSLTERCFLLSKLITRLTKGEY